MTKTQAGIIIAVVVIASVAGVLVFNPSKPATTTATATAAATMQGKTEFLVGYTQSLSGPFQSTQTSAFRGISVWVNWVNSQGGIYWAPVGKKIPVKLVTYDDQSDVTRVASLYEQLISVDHVDALLSPQGATLAAPADTVAAKHGVPIVNIAAGSDLLYKQGYKNLFALVSYSSTTEFPYQARFWQSLGIKSIAMLWENQPYPATWANSTATFAPGFGFNIVFNQKYETTDSNLVPVILSAKATNPDLFLVYGYPPGESRVVLQMKSTGWWPKAACMCAFGAGLGGSQLALPNNGIDAQYLFTGTNAGKHIYGATWNSTQFGPSENAFLAIYANLFGQGTPSDIVVSQGFGSALLLQYLIEKSGTVTDLDKIVSTATSLGTVVFPTTAWCYQPGGLNKCQMYPMGQALAGPTPNTVVGTIVFPAEYKDANYVYPAPMPPSWGH